MKGVAVDQLAVAKREDLDDGAIAFDRETDDVDRPDRAAIRGLPLRKMLDAPQPVAVPRGLLEAFVAGSLLHLPLQLALNRLGPSREKLDHLVDDRSVVLFADVAYAGREAALDVVIQTGDPGVPARLRALAWPVGEHAVEHVERLADLLRVRVRPEVDDTAFVALACEHDSRVFVLDGDSDVRKRLVVPEPHVERRPVAFDEVLLEMQGLHLVLGDDHLDVVDPLRQLPNRRPGVLRLLEVGANARPQRLGLADVEHVPGPVSKQVDTGLGRQRFQLILETLRHRFKPSQQGTRSSGAGRPAQPEMKRGPGGEPGPPQKSRIGEGGGELPGAPCGESPWQHNPDLCQLSVPSRGMTPPNG